MLFWAVLGWVLVGSWLRSHIPNEFLTGQSLFTEGWKTAHWNHDSGANTETTQQKWLVVGITTNLVSQVGWQTDHKLKFPFNLTFTYLHNILERPSNGAAGCATAITTSATAAVPTCPSAAIAPAPYPAAATAAAAAAAATVRWRREGAKARGRRKAWQSWWSHSITHRIHVCYIW